MKTLQETKTKLVALAITTTMFVGSSGYLYYDNNQISDQNQKQRIEIMSLSEMRSKLQKEIYSISGQLEKYKEKTKELEKFLATATNELTLKEQKIQNLVATNSSLKKYQHEAVELRKININNTNKINSLEERSNLLNSTNQALTSDNLRLKERLALIEEKNNLLEKKVQSASVLKIDNVIVVGEKKNKNGKYAITKFKKADRLLITFDLLENKTAEKGEKVVYVRVLGPNGKLIETTESGSFINNDNNVSMPYSKKQQVNYSSNKQKLSIPLDLGAKEAEKGTYKIEFFTDGNFSGVKKLDLK